MNRTEADKIGVNTGEEIYIEGHPFALTLLIFGFVVNDSISISKSYCDTLLQDISEPGRFYSVRKLEKKMVKRVNKLTIAYRILEPEGKDIDEKHIKLLLLDLFNYGFCTFNPNIEFKKLL